MSLLNANNYDRSKPDLTDLVPESGLKRWLFIFSNHFFRLMSLNLLFLLFCLPLVTIPASLCALTQTLLMLYRTGHCSPWQDFLTAFRRQFFGRFAVIFLLTFFPVSLCLWFFRFGLSSFGVGVGVVLFPLCTMTLCYFIALSASCESPVFGNLKNAFFTMIHFPIQSLKTLLVPVVFYLVSFYYLPYTFPLVAFIMFSAGQLALCCILENVIPKDTLN